jgi:hypothetical protein
MYIQFIFYYIFSHILLRLCLFVNLKTNALTYTYTMSVGLYLYLALTPEPALSPRQQVWVAVDLSAEMSVSAPSWSVNSSRWASSFTSRMSSSRKSDHTGDQPSFFHSIRHCSICSLVTFNLDTTQPHSSLTKQHSPATFPDSSAT